MNWRNIKLIFCREVRDQLRDRRTLFMILVLPVILYPALGLGMVSMALQFGERPRRIALVGRENLPRSPALLNPAGDRFDVDLFRNPSNQKYYEVLSKKKWTPADLLAGRFDALITIPEGTAEGLDAGGQVQLSVSKNGANDESERAYRAAISLLESWEERIVALRMRQAGKPDDFTDPIKIGKAGRDISPVSARSGTVWGRLFPFLLVIMALTGAFYPAIDLCAGEKERGTMETLLITPASRTEIVMGKFLAICLFCITVTVTNLGSMGLTFGRISSILPDQSRRTAEELAPPSLVAILWILLLMIPLAAFFSALCFALSAFAKSMKEGQYYLMPLFVVVMPLVFLTLAPGVELTLFYSLVPVTNVALLLRTLMLGQYETAMKFLLPVLIPTILYGYLALRFAISQFHREEVLFREAERLELGLWLRRLLRDKEPTPTSGQAWSCFLLLLVLRWYSQTYFPPTLKAQAIFLIAMIGFPPVLMSLLLTSRPCRALALNRPALTPTLLALAMVVALHPVALGVAELIEKLYPLADEIKQVAGRLLAERSLTEKLLVLALAPAVCEELAFRGFILSGLLRRYRPSAAVLISSVLFGMVHMIPQQMFGATLLGVLLGIIVIRSGSILPAMAFHAIHNGLMIFHQHRLATGEESGADSSAGYALTTILIAALIAAGLIAMLVHMPARLPRKDEPHTGR